MNMPALAQSESLRALVVEKDRRTAEAIARLVASLGYEVDTSFTLVEARAAVDRNLPGLVLAELDMPDGSGVDFIRELKAAGTEDIVIISGCSGRERVIEGLRLGVSDYLVKPVRLSTVESAVNTVLSLRQQRCIGVALPAGHSSVEPARLIGDSDAARRLREEVRSVAGSHPIRAVLQGAPGVGRRNIAASIHKQSLARGRCLNVYCAQEIDGATMLRFFGRKTDSNSNDTFSAEVKGYLELADSGTLILDDISFLPLPVQSKLTTFLNSGEFHPVNGGSALHADCAVIGILREPLQDAFDSGRLFADLYQSLAENVITVPSLSDRDGDAVQLAERFVATLNRSSGLEKSLSQNLRERLRTYDIPGNVLELRSILRSAWAGTAADDEIQIDRVFTPALVACPSKSASSLVGQTFRSVERKLLLATLEHYSGNKRRTARILGISSKTLYNRLNSYT